MFGEGYPFLRDVESPLTPEMLRPLDPRCRILQFVSLLTDADFERLAAFLVDYPEMPLRAYGSYDGSIRNLKFLRYFPKLRHFTVDVFEIEDLDGLQYLPSNLQSLGLGWTRSRRFSLGILERFPHLRTLFLEGHSKDIEALGQLTELEDLTLRSITLPNLSALLPLRNLQSLDIKLGGTKDLRLLREIGRLRYLELWMVKGLSDISAVSEILTLQFLFLQSLRQVTQLPSFSDVVALRRVHIESLKGLHDLTPLRTAPSLEEQLILDMPQLSVDDLRCLTNIPTLRRTAIYTGRQRTNDAIHQLLPLPDAERDGFEFR